MPAVEVAHRESQSSGKQPWQTCARVLHGMERVVSDDQAGGQPAIQEVLPETVWQRCYLHF